MEFHHIGWEGPGIVFNKIGQSTVIIMYAEDVKYDQETGKLQVKNAYASGNYDRQSNAIFIEEATFVFKFPTEVTIKNLKKSNSQKIINP